MMLAVGVDLLVGGTDGRLRVLDPDTLAVVGEQAGLDVSCTPWSPTRPADASCWAAGRGSSGSGGDDGGRRL